MSMLGARRLEDGALSTVGDYGAGHVPGPPPAAAAELPHDAAEAEAYGQAPDAASLAAHPGMGYDDSHPIGVPATVLSAGFPAAEASASSGEPVDDGLARIAAHDPAFHRDAFVAQVARIFVAAEQAWEGGDASICRGLMTHSLAAQAQLQLEDLQRQNVRNRLDGLSVAAVAVVSAESDGRFDSIRVRIHASSADYDVDVGSGRMLGGHGDVRPWAQEWTLQRSAHAHTRPDGGTLSRRCPSCQAPLEVDATGSCQFCRQPVMSGDYDWVLTRIDEV